MMSQNSSGWKGPMRLLEPVVTHMTLSNSSTISPGLLHEIFRNKDHELTKSRAYQHCELILKYKFR